MISINEKHIGRLFSHLDFNDEFDDDLSEREIWLQEIIHKILN
jgi:hypothetical protein